MNNDAAALDASLKSMLPLLEVGVYSPFQPLREPGARILLTADGLMLESCNGVHHAITPMGRYDSPIKLPYGKVPTGVDVIDTTAAMQLQSFAREFLGIAAKQAPKEILMLVVKAPGKPMRSIHASLNETEESLVYQDWVHMAEDEHIILDIHSHGKDAAFFSHTDNIDDCRFRGFLKTCCVIGCADQTTPQQVQRWVSRGHIFQESIPASVAV